MKTRITKKNIKDIVLEIQNFNQIFMKYKYKEI